MFKQISTFSPYIIFFFSNYNILNISFLTMLVAKPANVFEIIIIYYNFNKHTHRTYIMHVFIAMLKCI